MSKKFISLKEAAKIFGYHPDYIGYLIRKKRIPGKKKYSEGIWEISRRQVFKYLRKKHKKINYRKQWRYLFFDKYISLKEAGRIFGYAPDYVGYLIRTGQISGRKINYRINWVTTEEIIGKYQKFKKNRLLRFLYIKIPQYSLVFAIFVFLIFSSLIAFAFSPKNSTLTAEIYPNEIKGEWQNIRNIEGPPKVSEDGDINLFSETNSALYKEGPLTLLLQKFQQTETQQNQGQSQETIPEENQIQNNGTSIGVDRPMSFFKRVKNLVFNRWEKIKNYFGNSIVQAQQIPTFEEITKQDFVSAKIKFSFAIGEKAADLEILEEILKENNEPQSSQKKPISFWQKTKGFFINLNFFANISPNANPQEVGTNDESNGNFSSTDLDTKIIVWYSLDYNPPSASSHSPDGERAPGENWQVLDTISSSPLSNALNGGYFTYDAPFLKNWDDVKNLKIKFEGVAGGETKLQAYLDSLWMEVGYFKKI
jgi:hypothetical protein